LQHFVKNGFCLQFSNIQASCCLRVILLTTRPKLA
jgi:hypothetical protein